MPNISIYVKEYRSDGTEASSQLIHTFEFQGDPNDDERINWSDTNTDTKAIDLELPWTIDECWKTFDEIDESYLYKAIVLDVDTTNLTASSFNEGSTIFVFKSKDGEDFYGVSRGIDPFPSSDFIYYPNQSVEGRSPSNGYIFTGKESEFYPNPPYKFAKSLGTMDISVCITLEANIVYKALPQIQITTDTPSSQIYYTLDNSIPDSSKSLYSNQFEVESGTTIKAIGIKEGYIDSDIATLTV